MTARVRLTADEEDRRWRALLATPECPQALRAAEARTVAALRAELAEARAALAERDAVVGMAAEALRAVRRSRSPSERASADLAAGRALGTISAICTSHVAGRPAFHH